jgi:universal stress protein F
MYSSILIPVALDHETLVAQKLIRAREMLAPGGKITLLTVLEQVSGFVAEFVTVKSENHLTSQHPRQAAKPWPVMRPTSSAR